jgi:hypothetical protein
MARDNHATDAFADTDGGGKFKAKQAPKGRAATRSLRRARALYEDAEWQPSREAEFLVQEATVLALIDVAEAIREQTGERT